MGCVQASDQYTDQEVTPLTAPCTCGGCEDTFSVKLSNMQMWRRVIKSSSYGGGSWDSQRPEEPESWLELTSLVEEPFLLPL